MLFADTKIHPKGLHASTSLCFIQTIGSGSNPDSWPFLPGYVCQNIHVLCAKVSHSRDGSKSYPSCLLGLVQSHNEYLINTFRFLSKADLH